MITALRVGLLAACLVVGLAGGATAKEKITFAYLLDPSHDAVVYALKNGKVKSDLIDVEVRSLAIPALIQATSARQYDVVQTAVISIPRAEKQGLKLAILSTALRYHVSGEGADIWVKADSPIKSVEDLKGKTVGVYGISSTGITLIRLALWKKYGVNVALQGGDMRFVEMPAPSLPAALSTGRIDAATLIHSQAFAAAKSGEFRSVAQTAKDMHETFGLRMVSAVNVGYPDKIEARPAAYREFNRVLKASLDYALSHQDEVFTAVGKETNVDPAFFARWFNNYSEFPAVITDQDVQAIEKVWALSKELGLIDSYPDAKGLIWSGALRQ
jgi:NitT/TauT family transport system substrate-binding protein